MPIQHHNVSSDSGRTPIDRHAVSAAGQLLMSAIWLSIASTLPDSSQRVGKPTIIRCACGELLGSRPSPRGLLVPVGWDN